MPEEPNDPTNPDPDPPPDPDAGAKKALDAERREHNKTKKQLSDIQAQIKELQDKDKPEVERLTRRVTELEGELSNVTAKLMRAEVALDKGLTKTQARRLVGATEEELVTDADDLLASFKPTNDSGDDPPADDSPKPPPGAPPRETLRPGTAPADPEPDLRKVIAEIPR